MPQERTKHLFNTERIPTVEAHYHLMTMMTMTIMGGDGWDDDDDDDHGWDDDDTSDLPLSLAENLPCQE